MQKRTMVQIFTKHLGGTGTCSGSVVKLLSALLGSNASIQSGRFYMEILQKKISTACRSQ